MMKIAIVDDDRVVLFALSQKIKGYLQTKCVSYAIETFASGTDLLEQREPFDILFLDIQMDGLSGMETAKLLRQKGVKSVIVFITALQEYVYDAFEVGTFDYILKPIDPIRFTRMMDRLYHNSQTADTKNLLIPSKGNTYQTLFFREIYYLEAVNHKIEFHTKDAIYRGYFKVTEIVKLLDNRFFQCHRSYLVNLDFVCGYAKGLALLHNGKQIPVSRLRRSAFSQAVLGHMKGKREP